MKVIDSYYNKCVREIKREMKKKSVCMTFILLLFIFILLKFYLVMSRVHYTTWKRESWE